MKRRQCLFLTKCCHLSTSSIEVEGCPRGKMVALVGVIMGLLTLFIPPLFWPRAVPQLSDQAFVEQYPDKRWIYYVHFALPLFWVFLYLIVIAPVLWRIGDEHLYLISFTIGGGLAIGHGIVEILTNVSTRNFSRGGPATYLVHDSIRRLGWMRVGLVLFLGLVPWGAVTFLL